MAYLKFRAERENANADKISLDLEVDIVSAEDYIKITQAIEVLESYVPKDKPKKKRRRFLR